MSRIKTTVVPLRSLAKQQKVEIYASFNEIMPRKIIHNFAGKRD